MFGKNWMPPGGGKNIAHSSVTGRCGHKEWAKTMLDDFLWIDLLLDLPNMDLLNGFLWVYSWFLWPAVTMVFMDLATDLLWKSPHGFLWKWSNLGDLRPQRVMWTLVEWFAPVTTVVRYLCTINHSEIGVCCANLALSWPGASHCRWFDKFC